MHQENQSRNKEHCLRSLIQSIPKPIEASKLLKNKWTKLVIILLGTTVILILIWLFLSDAERRQIILYPLVLYILIQGINKLFAHRKDDENQQ